MRYVISGLSTLTETTSFILEFAVDTTVSIFKALSNVAKYEKINVLLMLLF